MRYLSTAARLLLIFTLLTGVLYPLSVTLFGQALFPVQANGNLITVDGQVIGSALIAQSSSDPHYFWSRPSAVNTLLGTSLDALGSSGASNQGGSSATLRQAQMEREQAFRAAHALAADAIVPAEMLFASGSGLDPHISPEAARLQVARIAEARNLPAEQVAALVEGHIEGPDLGFMGQARVNVLRLNLALNALP